MVASAAGLASCGKIPFLYTITNFMSMHAFEFIRNDVCIANQNVKFLGRSSGLVSSSMGATHQGTEEVALLRTLPHMLVITPATPIEAREATRFAYHHRGPVYIRLEGFNEPELYDEDYQFSVGRGCVLRDGGDITVISMGSIVNETLSAAGKLESDGINVRIINMPMVNPIDRDLIVAAAKETGHSIHGGLGSAVAEVLAECGLAVSFQRMGLDGCAKGCGNREAMRKINGLASGNVMEKVRESLQR